MKPMAAKEDGAIYFYRYTSLSLTSIVFLLGDSNPPSMWKMGVVLALFIAVKWITAFYRRSHKGSRTFKVAVGLEMAGMICLLISTGGMDSPFLWCVMNPTLIAASYLSTVYCWFILLGYLLFVTSFSYFIAGNSDHSIWRIVLDNSDFYLVLLLMTLAIQVLAGMKNKLERANTRTNETMEHIKSLYQIVEAATQSESGNLQKIFAEFAFKLTKQKMAFFWDVNGEDDEDKLIVQGKRFKDTEASLCAAIESNLTGLRRQDNCTVMNLPGHGEFLITPVKSASKFWGVLGIKIERWNHEEGSRWFVQQLYFLSELCAVILERHRLERIENQLMIIEEQNRIADEMHDSVSQHMFGIVYAIHSLNRKWQDIPADQLKTQLEFIRESANTASQELRTTIYSLSSRKSGAAFWLSTVQAHLDSLSKLYAVKIRLNVTGDDHRLPVSHQKALSRIISEAAGNAIRHGSSSSIVVELCLKPSEVKLAVSDNGEGFDVNVHMSDPKVSGLGLSNMKFLVQSLGGTLQISSNQGEGTRISVFIPMDQQDKKALEEVMG